MVLSGQLPFPAALLPQKWHRVPAEQEAGWASGPVWMFRGKETALAVPAAVSGGIIWKWISGNLVLRLWTGLYQDKV